MSDSASPPTARQGRATSPPTVRQGAATGSPPTARQDGAAPPSGSPPTWVQQGGKEGDFPESLRTSYTPQEVAGAGSEGVVWRVLSKADGTEAAVKVAHRGAPATDQKLLAQLEQRKFVRHVPRIDGAGVDGDSGRSWIAMEFLPLTLEAYLRDAPFDQTRAHELVRELAQMLAFWQDEIKHNPIDFKPANILLRPAGAGPAEFVFADFGGVARQTASQVFSPVNATLQYMAPEGTARANRLPNAWYSLGLILYQAFTGRLHYEYEPGLQVSDEAYHYDLVTGDIDLSAVADSRQKSLLRGLLTRDPRYRWTASQVNDWLAGKTPPVHKEELIPPTPRPDPITFRMRSFREPSSLASAMAEDFKDAAAWLDGSGARTVKRWLEQDVKDSQFDRDVLEYSPRTGTREDWSALAALAFVSVFRRESTPVFRGVRVDADGVWDELAKGAEGLARLRKVHRDVWPLAARFHCSHAQCTAGGGCAVLLLLVRRTLDTSAAKVAEVADDLGRRTGDNEGPELSRLEEAVAATAIAQVTIDPAGRRVRLLAMLGVRGKRGAPVWTRGLPTAVIAALVRAATLLLRGRSNLRRRNNDQAFEERWADLRDQAVRADVTTDSGCADLAAVGALASRSTFRPPDPSRPYRPGIGPDSVKAWLRSNAIKSLCFTAAALTAVIGYWSVLGLAAFLEVAILRGSIVDPGGFAVGIQPGVDPAVTAQGTFFAVAISAALTSVLIPYKKPSVTLVLVVLVAAAGFIHRYLPGAPDMPAPDWLMERVRAGLAGSGELAPITFLVVSLVCAGALIPVSHVALKRSWTLLTADPDIPQSWSGPSAGLLHRLLFTLLASCGLVGLLWAVVGLRPVLPWFAGESQYSALAGSGQEALALWLVPCVAASALVSLFPPRTAASWQSILFVGVLAVGTVPVVEGAARAIAVPLAGLVGQSASADSFWSAALLVLPLSVMLHRSAPAVIRWRTP